ncbi:hypothetical protein [Kribbella sp. NPDC050470]|uniref:hypothetical protein n=1 Tax=unclassified Kribbella TaxID=2644121 RepID=UPI0037B6C738
MVRKSGTARVGRDCAILLSGVAAEPLRRAVTAIRAGAEGARRDSTSIEVTVSAHTTVTDDVDRDARVPKPVLAAIAQRGGQAALEAAGINLAVPEHIPDVKPDLIHAENWDQAVEVCSNWISDADAARFARRFLPVRYPRRDCLRNSGDLGAWVSAACLQHVGSWDLPTTLVAEVGRTVLPLLNRT